MLWCTSEEQYPFNFFDELHLYGTYEDWLAGGPKVRDMPDLVKRWESRAIELHPGWPIHTAVQTEDYRDDGFLPSYVCIGNFRSNWTREPNWCGSAMVIVWYQEKCPIDDGMTLPKMAKADWEAVAKDFDY
jgi:hypothetical protein